MSMQIHVTEGVVMRRFTLAAGLSCVIALGCAEADAVACGRCVPNVSRTLDYLAHAEEHRGWVEFWIDLDTREARSELGYFAHDLRLAGETLATEPCREEAQVSLLRDRIRHEWQWQARKSRLFEPASPSAQTLARAPRP